MINRFKRFITEVNCSFDAGVLVFVLNKNPCRQDREVVSWSFRWASTSLPRGYGNDDCGGRPGSPHGVRNTVARQRRTFTGFAFTPSHPGVRRRIRTWFDY